MKSVVSEYLNDIFCKEEEVQDVTECLDLRRHTYLVHPTTSRREQSNNYYIDLDGLPYLFYSFGQNSRLVIIKVIVCVKYTLVISFFLDLT